MVTLLAKKDEFGIYTLDDFTEDQENVFISCDPGGEEGEDWISAAETDIAETLKKMINELNRVIPGEGPQITLATRVRTNLPSHNLDSLLHAFSWTETIVDVFDTKENRRLTKEYPHDCFNKECQGVCVGIHDIKPSGPLKLKFQDVMLVNPSIPHEELMKLWKSPYVQFYCCTCKRDLEIRRKRKRGKTYIHVDEVP